MKRFLLLSMLCLVLNGINAQLLLNESFNGLGTGDLPGKGTPVWLPFTTTGSNPNPLLQTTTPLTYAGYNAGGGAEYVSIFQKTGSVQGGRSTYKYFSQSVALNTGAAPTNTFYYSFLVRVTEANQIADQANYSVALRRADGTSESESVGRFVISKETGANGKWRFGLAAGSTQTFAATTKTSNSPSDVYLILIRYDMIANNSDVAYMWINPSLAAEPSLASADATSTTGQNGFGDRIDCLMILQRDTDRRPAADFDGFKVAVGTTSAAAFASLGTQIPQPV
ncbi:MAG: hypothetical protein H7Y27_11635, partial [Gemmatimonadaceae bacterium]|nr:hypothetical protein [Chitinophagaceae bacterium]